jgi:hypothetical protein
VDFTTPIQRDFHPPYDILTFFKDHVQVRGKRHKKVRGDSLVDRMTLLYLYVSLDIILYIILILYITIRNHQTSLSIKPYLADKDIRKNIYLPSAVHERYVFFVSSQSRPTKVTICEKQKGK